MYFFREEWWWERKQKLRNRVDRTSRCLSLRTGFVRHSGNEHSIWNQTDWSSHSGSSACWLMEPWAEHWTFSSFNDHICKRIFPIHRVVVKIRLNRHKTLAILTYRMCPHIALSISVCGLPSRLYNSHTYHKATGRFRERLFCGISFAHTSTHGIEYVFALSSTHLWPNHLRYSQIFASQYHTLLHSHSRSPRTVHYQKAPHSQGKSHFLRWPQIHPHCGPQKRVPLFPSRCQ